MLLYDSVPSGHMTTILSSSYLNMLFGYMPFTGFFTGIGAIICVPYPLALCLFNPDPYAPSPTSFSGLSPLSLFCCATRYIVSSPSYVFPFVALMFVIYLLSTVSVLFALYPTNLLLLDFTPNLASGSTGDTYASFGLSFPSSIFILPSSSILTFWFSTSLSISTLKLNFLPRSRGSMYLYTVCASVTTFTSAFLRVLSSAFHGISLFILFLLYACISISFAIPSHTSLRLFFSIFRTSNVALLISRIAVGTAMSATICVASILCISFFFISPSSIRWFSIVLNTSFSCPLSINLCLKSFNDEWSNGLSSISRPRACLMRMSYMQASSISLSERSWYIWSIMAHARRDGDIAGLPLSLQYISSKCSSFISGVTSSRNFL